MADGMVGAIRARLDHAGFGDVPILSYVVKYESSFSAPFETPSGAPRPLGTADTTRWIPEIVACPSERLIKT